MEVESDERFSQAQLKGIVMITLPPPHNPSSGKTITTLTLSDRFSSAASPQESLPQHDQQPSTSSPQLSLPQLGDQPQLTTPPQNHQSLSFFFNNRGTYRIVLPILVVTLIATYLWVSLSPETLSEIKIGNDVDDDDRNYENKPQHTFLFPLHHKKRPPYRDFREVRLEGRFVGFDGAMSKEKSMSTGSMINANGVLPVVGNVYHDGLYYTYLHFGNPRRPYFLDIDTGSDLTWIQCDAHALAVERERTLFTNRVKLTFLPHRDPYCVEIQRNHRSNDCASCHQCDYMIEYADHSSSMGVLLKDEVYINIANGSLANSKAVFGCTYDQQGLLLNTLEKTDGILGLGRGKASLPSQLATQGIIKNVIGHCLANDAIGGGNLFLGDDFVPHWWQMAWVPMLQSHDLNSYQTKVEKMSSGSKQIGLGNGQGHLVFDSGSSYSYFPEQAYKDLVTILNEVSSESLVRDMSDTSFPICWRAKSPIRSVNDVRELFKPIILQFGCKWWIFSTKLQIPAEGYLVINKNKGNVCLGILNGREVHDGSTFILGDISLRGLLMVYDNVKEKIGWVRSECALPQRSESHFVD